MALFYFPVKGLHKAQPASVQPAGTTSSCNNVRPYAGGRLQGGQRPALKKAYSEQIGGSSTPIIELLSITTVD
jgi:hypothetical protein